MKEGMDSSDTAWSIIDFVIVVLATDGSRIVDD